MLFSDIVSSRTNIHDPFDVSILRRVLICSDNNFITEFDSIMRPTSNNSNFDVEDIVIDHIAMNTGETSMNIASIVLLNDTDNYDRLLEIDSNLIHIIYEFLSSLPKFNEARAQQRQNAFIGLQGQGGLVANMAREVSSYL